MAASACSRGKVASLSQGRNRPLLVIRSRPQRVLRGWRRLRLLPAGGNELFVNSPKGWSVAGTGGAGGVIHLKAPQTILATPQHLEGKTVLVDPAF